jgi:hypothetical protein
MNLLPHHAAPVIPPFWTVVTLITRPIGLGVVLGPMG